MTSQTTLFTTLSALALSVALAASPPTGETEAGQRTEPMTKRSCWVTAVDPKPLSENVRRGLAWLVGKQHDDGGWAQGEESRSMGGNLAATPNVGDTSAATLSLIRSGSTPSQGPYADAIFKALGFIMTHVEASDPESLSVMDVQGTRLHAKLGPNIDIFLASLVLTEAAGHMPNQASENRLATGRGSDSRTARGSRDPAGSDTVTTMIEPCFKTCRDAISPCTRAGSSRSVTWRNRPSWFFAPTTTTGSSRT